MKARARLLTAVFAAGLVVPLIGISTAASASVRPNAKSVTSTTTPTCGIFAHPAGSFRETDNAHGAESVAFVFDVECKPAVAAGSTVDIEAGQLFNACQGNLTWSDPAVSSGAPTATDSSLYTVTLDSDGNAEAIAFGGPNCVAESGLRVDANLVGPPRYAFYTTVKIVSPGGTSIGLEAMPGVQVEDSATSSVGTILYAHFNAEYEGVNVTFADPTLANACAGGVEFWGPDEYFLGSETATSESNAVNVLDDNGNAWAVAIGIGPCAPGATTAEAELGARPYTTLTTSFTVETPRTTPT